MFEMFKQWQLSLQQATEESLVQQPLSELEVFVELCQGKIAVCLGDAYAPLCVSTVIATSDFFAII